MTSSRLSAIALATLSAIVAAALGFGSTARSEPLDPTLAIRRVVGDPAGASPTDRVDVARTGRARTLLPQKPKVRWRTRIAGGVDHPLVVDDRLSIVAAGTELVQIEASGRVAWTARTGAALPASGAFITSDGSRVVVTSASELFAFDRAGKLRFRTALPSPGPQRFQTAAVPLDDGALIVALNTELLRVEANGDDSARASLDDPVRAVARAGDRIVIVTQRGDVYTWQPPGQPKRVGGFGGRVDDAVLASPGRLTAVVNDVRLVDFVLGAGARFARISDGALRLRGPPAILANGETRLVSADGVLLGHDVYGRETFRVPLEPAAQLGDAGAPRQSLSDAPPVIVDADGSVGFVRAGLDAGVVSSDGSVAAAEGTGCTDPVSVAPAGPHRMVVACRAGLVFLLSD